MNCVANHFGRVGCLFFLNAVLLLGLILGLERRHEEIPEAAGEAVADSGDAGDGTRHNLVAAVDDRVAGLLDGVRDGRGLEVGSSH